MVKSYARFWDMTSRSQRSLCKSSDKGILEKKKNLASCKSESHDGAIELKRRRKGENIKFTVLFDAAVFALSFWENQREFSDESVYARIKRDRTALVRLVLPNTMTKVIFTVLIFALGMRPLEDALLVSLVGPWRSAPPCAHIVATMTM